MVVFLKIWAHFWEPIPIQQYEHTSGYGTDILRNFRNIMSKLRQMKYLVCKLN